MLYSSTSTVPRRMVAVLVPMLMFAAAQTASACSCRSPQGPPHSIELWPGLYITKEAAHCNGSRPETCTPASWAQENVPLCVLGDLEILLPSPEPRPIVLHGSDPAWTPGNAWSLRLQKLANLYRNHSCHYLGNRHDCREQDPNDAFNMEQFGIIGQYDGPVKAAVLDYGADPSGQQFQVFREYFDGPLVGWNVRTPHETIRPSHHIKASDIGNFTLVFGERDSCLPFQDDSFDYVWSLNVLEHVTPMRPYLEEIHRVLKPGGIFWGKYNPSWFSARGHHIQKGMVQDWEAWFLSEGHDECRDIEYEDDGRTMPHWGHLYLTEEELKAHLRTTPLGKCERMVQQFADWLFRYDLVWGTNKIHYQEVLAILKDIGMLRINVSMSYDDHQHMPSTAVLRRIGAKYGHGDVIFNDVEMIYYKPLESGVGHHYAEHQQQPLESGVGHHYDEHQQQQQHGTKQQQKEQSTAKTTKGWLRLHPFRV